MRRFPQSLSSRLLFALTFISLISVSSLGLAAYVSERAALIEEVQGGLDTIARLKEEQIVGWLHGRQSDLRLVATNNLYREQIIELMEPDLPLSQREQYRKILLNSLSTLSSVYPEYRHIEIFNTDGNVIVSTNSRLYNAQTDHEQIFRKTMRSSTGRYVEDVHRNPETREIEIILGQAIYESDRAIGNRNPPIIGVVIAHISLEETFFDLAGRWPGISQTGQVILGRDAGDELLVLNALRRSPDSALRLRIPKNSQHPGALELGIKGLEGVTVRQDYKGVPVVAAYRPVRGTAWGIVVKVEQSEALAPIAELAWQLLALALFTLFLAWMAAFILWRRITTPLSHLVQATQEVMMGNYELSPIATNDDEIGTLSSSFQRMVATLNSRQKELVIAYKKVEDTAVTNMKLAEDYSALNAGLEAKVLERTKELSEANVKLTELDRLKSKFISNVSHELRNPVASLKLYLRLLEKGNDQNRARYVASISNQIDWLSKLIESILDITQLERGTADLQLDYVDLNLILQQAVEIYEPIANDSDVDLTWDVPAAPTNILGNEDKLIQMLTNLLTNAVNYTPSGAIAVELRHVGENAVIAISDTGIGIDSEDLPHLFNRFYRGKNTHELEIRGTGLGLGIVKEIVDIHQGRIEVESEIAVGSRFQIFLPLTQLLNPKLSASQHRFHAN